MASPYEVWRYYAESLSCALLHTSVSEYFMAAKLPFRICTADASLLILSINASLYLNRCWREYSDYGSRSKSFCVFLLQFWQVNLKTALCQSVRLLFSCLKFVCLQSYIYLTIYNTDNTVFNHHCRDNHTWNCN